MPEPKPSALSAPSDLVSFWPEGSLVGTPKGSPRARGIGAPAAFAPSATPQAPSESVVRPEPGLARGAWEAPPSYFVVAAAVAAGAGIALANRWLRRRRSGATRRGPR